MVIHNVILFGRQRTVLYLSPRRHKHFWVAVGHVDTAVVPNIFKIGGQQVDMGNAFALDVPMPIPLVEQILNMQPPPQYLMDILNSSDILPSNYEDTIAAITRQLHTIRNVRSAYTVSTPLA